MDRRVARELIHIKTWLVRADRISTKGRAHYMHEEILQEAGDALMMKIGEAANRLTKLDVQEPEGIDWALAVANRNFLIHQYDVIDRDQTWLTLSTDLPAWYHSLAALFAQAEELFGPVEPVDRPVVFGDLQGAINMRDDFDSNSEFDLED